MKKILHLSDFYDSTFCFYLDDVFRNKIFAQLKADYLDWGVVARILKIDRRNLFGFRRGWELRHGKKKKFPIPAHLLLRLKKTTKTTSFLLERHIIFAKYGRSGVDGDIRFPLHINDESLIIASLYGALYDHILKKEIEKL